MMIHDSALLLIVSFLSITISLSHVYKISCYFVFWQSLVNEYDDDDAAADDNVTEAIDNLNFTHQSCQRMFSTFTFS